MSKRKLTALEKQSRRYVLRLMNEYYHPDFKERNPIYSRAEYLKLMMENIERVLDKELEGDERRHSLITARLKREIKTGESDD